VEFSDETEYFIYMSDYFKDSNFTGSLRFSNCLAIVIDDEEEATKWGIHIIWKYRKSK
jgi:hypothetical protein